MAFSYLDHAATTPLRPEAREAMAPWLDGHFGNPSGVHRAARAARRALEEARDRIAAGVGASPHDVVFTSGGTEALNLAVRGLTVRPGDAMAVSAIEHDAVRQSAWRRRDTEGVRFCEIPVGSDGLVRTEQFEGPFGRVGQIGELGQSGRVGVIAVMAANNEIGTVQPLKDIRERWPDAVVVVDAVCAVPWVDICDVYRHADVLALSAHKFGGPQGIGALVVRQHVDLEAQIRGGGQEHDRRSGTQNVVGAVGMAAALDAASGQGRGDELTRVGLLRDRLGDGLLAAIDDAYETGARAAKTAGNVHLCFDGVESEALLLLLDADGVAASAGSACASGALHASHVLLAMGIAKQRALGSLRLTLGWSTTADDVAHALDVVPRAVARLRS